MTEMPSTIGTVSMPIILDQTEAESCDSFNPNSHSNHIGSLQGEEMVATQSSIDLSSLQDYGPMCNKLESATKELINCSVQNSQEKQTELNLSAASKGEYLLPCKIRGRKSKLIIVNSATPIPVPAKENVAAVVPSDLVHVELTHSNVVPANHFFFKPSNSDHLLCETLVKPSNSQSIRVKTSELKEDIQCYKCSFCPLMTLDKERFDMHHGRQGACANDLQALKCPGCDNVFFSNTSLRVHLANDHHMPAKEVRIVISNASRVRLNYNINEIKSSCVYETNERVILNNAASYSSPNISLVLSSNSSTSERSSCANGKRPTMLESYLDDINSKNDCNIPPRLTQNGSDLLENTFNFTAPVSEQLPSIQPENTSTSGGIDQTLLADSTNLEIENGHFMDPNNAISEKHHLLDVRSSQTHLLTNTAISEIDLSTNNRTLDQQSRGDALESEHLVVETTVTSNFLTIPSSYGHRNEDNYKTNEQNNYVYISEDIPEIQLDDKLNHDFDFVTEEPAPVVTPPSEEKKVVEKKIGCGFRCDINGCKFRMQSDTNIAYHRRCHEGKIYNCPECCKDCPTWISLSSHLWQAHKIDMELYKCDLCPYRTPSYSRLTSIHRGIHGLSRPYLCDICGKGFKTVKQMRNHTNTHKAKMVRMSRCFCNICGRTTADKRILEQHINFMHKKKKPFLCSICGYAAARKHSLLVHMRKHTGEKPHKCDKCEYRTADHNALRRHVMKHSGARSYKCTQCSYSCIQASTFKAHIKIKHPALESQLIFSCSHCNFQTLQRGTYLSHTAEHRNKMAPFYSDDVELGPIITDRDVETIVDLSSAQGLLQDDYYEVDRIAEQLDQPVDTLKMKT